MKTLVTGGAGFIGSHFVRHLLEKKKSVVVIDNLSTGFRQVIEVLQQKYGPETLVFYEADLLNYSQIAGIFKKEKIETVLHFAASALVSESMAKPYDYFENNLLGIINLLRAMDRARVSDLVFSSTCAVYGNSQYLPVDEKHSTNPESPYGESKRMIEKIITWAGKLKGLHYVIFRYFNVAGSASDGLIGDSAKPSTRLVQNAVRGALGIEAFRLVCPQVDTPDGSPIRDYVNVEDLVDAHWSAVNYLKKGGRNDTFNLGTGKGNSVLEIVNQVQRITKTQFPALKGKTRKGEYAAVFADYQKAKSILGWQPKRSLHDSVESLIKWYKNHPHGWDY